MFIQINKFRKLLIIPINDSRDSNRSSTFTVLVVATFTKKEKDKVAVAKQSHYLLLSPVFVSESYIFCDSCKCRFMEN